MSEKLSMCKSSDDQLCFSMVHVGVNKWVPNATTLENYQKSTGV